jgi:hypothetical protein
MQMRKSITLSNLIPSGVFLVISSYVLSVLSFNDIADVDLWGYLAFGRMFWESGGFPYQDVFAYVPTLDPWVYHEWLTGVVFYPIYQKLGPPGLQMLKYVFGLGTLLLVYMTATRRGAHPLVAGILIAVVAGGAKISYMPVRAQVFTFFFFALSLFLLERARLSGKWRGLWLLPLIQIPWCNLHGGFVAGLGLIVFYALGEFVSRRPFVPYIGILLVSIAATLINPYGLAYWDYVVRAVAKPRPHVSEWASIFQLYYRGEASIMLPIHVFLLTFLGLFAMWQSRWREITASLALFVTLLLGLKHSRHITFYFLLWGAYLPSCARIQVEYIQSHKVLYRLWQRAGVKLSFLMGLIFLIFIFSYVFFKSSPFSLKIPGHPVPGKIHYPVGGVHYIKNQGLSGRIVTVFGWGEYLIWNLYPQCLVGFDGRYETVYPEKVEKEYTEFIYAGPKWRQFLHNYPTDLILLDPRNRISILIKEDPEWQEIFKDSGCVLFRKRHIASENAALNLQVNLKDSSVR